MSSIVKWLSRCFQLDDLIRNEALIVCPRCKRPKLYFNVKKKIGHCHYDKCAYHAQPVLLEDLIQIVGYGPEDDPGWVSWKNETTDSTSSKISLPEGAHALVELEAGIYKTRFPVANQAVMKRGVLSEDQYRFNLHFDGRYVYIPVYVDGRMVQYVGRAAWWFESRVPRYNYGEGYKISNLLFNWDTCKRWPKITCVENTFNAIAYRNELYSVSTFGSHLSDTQANLIAGSAAESVALLWDEGADRGAAKAVRKLKKLGIPAAFGRMTGQPDDHPLEWLCEAAGKVHDAAVKNQEWVTL